MKRVFLLLLVLLCVTTAFSYGGGVHVTPHITPHVSVHTTPHVSSYHSTPHYSYGHVSHSTSRIRPTYHPMGYYYHVIVNNSTHRNDTIKADTEEELNDKLISQGEVREEEGVSGAVLIVGLIVFIALVGFISTLD